MDENYSDAPDAMTAQAAASNSAHADETPKGNEDQPTALLPKSILAGKDFQPGEEIVLKIKRIMDDQVEVEYSTGKEAESPKEDAGEPGEEPPSNPMSEYMG